MGNVLVLKSSPRPGGNSSVLADKVASSIEAEGVAVQSVDLAGKDIHPCNACDACRRSGECVVEDYMQELGPKIAEADALVLASPIYFFTYSAQLKTCIDRWYALWNGNHDVFRGKPVGIVLTYGDEDPYVSGAINAIHTFQTMFGFLDARIAGIVYGTVSDVGDAEKQPELMRRASALGKRIAKALKK